ncbi:hypothetical protein FPV67DRAFT_1464230 [Lyophyllum atratum]|nr:hypothetical protein FPV67DRAFT_1464230 [Lyophyllum atratum]
MASLPPKPQDSSLEKADARPPPDERDRRPARPLRPPQGGGRQYRNGRFNSPPGDRVYVPRRTRSPPRWPPVADSYVAPSYDGRRDPDFRRRDHGDRGHGSWDRDAGQRYREPSPDYERNRRGFDRERPHERDMQYDRHRDQYGPHTRRGPSPRRDMPRWRSRSPQRRRPSPSPPHRRPRSRSPPYRSPPPHKRMRLGNHSIEASPRHEHRPRPPPQAASTSRDRSHSPERRSRSRSPVPPRRETMPQNKAENHEQEVPEALPSMELPPERSTNIASEQRAPSRTPPPTPQVPSEPPTSAAITAKPTVSSPPREPLADRYAAKKKEPEPEPEVKPVIEETKPRERSRSPPRQPRHHGPQSSSTLPRRTSRSPPRGPRNHARGMTPTGPASFHPSGPRGQRRPYQAPTSLPTPPIPQNPAPSALVEDQPAPVTEPGIKFPLPHIPIPKLPPSLTPDFDAEIARLQVHRAHLASEYTQLAKGNRRALHELDLSTIDLRAAELRRKVADIQYQKARNGALGIDYAVETSIV